MNEYVAFSANDFPHIKKLVLDADSHGFGHSRKLETMARILNFGSLNALLASMNKKTETYVINFDAGVHFLLGTDPAIGTSHLSASLPEAKATFEIYSALRQHYAGRDPRPESLVYLTDGLRQIWSDAERTLSRSRRRDAGSNGHLRNHPNNPADFYVRCLLRHLDSDLASSPSKIMEIAYNGAYFDMARGEEVVDIERMRKSLDAVEALAAELDILVIAVELNFAPDYAVEVEKRGYGLAEFDGHPRGTLVKAFGPDSTKAIQRLKRRASA
jgi:hypothetical protein